MATSSVPEGSSRQMKGVGCGTSGGAEPIFTPTETARTPWLTRTGMALRVKLGTSLYAPRCPCQLPWERLHRNTSHGGGPQHLAHDGLRRLIKLRIDVVGQLDKELQHRHVAGFKLRIVRDGMPEDVSFLDCLGEPLPSATHTPSNIKLEMLMHRRTLGSSHIALHRAPDQPCSGGRV